MWIAVMLVILGLFPSVAGVIQAVPEPVLGVRQWSCLARLQRRASIGQHPPGPACAADHCVSLALGLGVAQVPEFLAHMPAAVRNVLESGWRPVASVPWC